MTSETALSLAVAGRKRQTVQTARRLAECSTCTPMTHRSKVPTDLQQLPNIRNKEDCLTASMTWLRGCSLIGCISTSQRERFSAVHPVEDIIPASAGRLQSRHRLLVSILFCSRPRNLRRFRYLRQDLRHQGCDHTNIRIDSY